MLTGQARDGSHYIDRKNRTNAGLSAIANGGMNNPLRKGVIAKIPLTTAPAELLPFEQNVGEANRQAAGCNLGEDAAACMALNPLTSADMVRYFLATFFPRHAVYGLPAEQRVAQEMAFGQLQAQVLFGMRDGLYHAVVDERMPEAMKQQVKGSIYQLIAGITGCQDANNDGAADGMCGDAVLTRSYGSYAEFLAAVDADPSFQGAQQLVTQGATPYFTPPSLFHVRANGWHHGLLNLDYVAHGLHFSMFTAQGAGLAPSLPPTVDPSTAQPNFAGYGCKNMTGFGKQDYSMYQCVRLPDVNWAQNNATDPSGKCQLAGGYCDGDNSVKCCLPL